MNTRTRDLTRGVIATLALGAVIVALPIALAALVGWPLPRTTPTIDTLRWRLTNGQVPDAFWINACACVLWTAWAQLTIAAVAELVAVARGRTIRLPRGLGWAQHTVARLVATATLLTALAQPPAYATVTLGTFTSLTHNVAVATSSAGGVATLAPSVVNEDSAVARGWVVKRLDTLWGIAESVLGDGNRWPEIRDPNIGSISPHA